MQQQYKWTGALQALASAVIFSFGGLVIKSVPWNPLAINGVRTAVAMVLTFIFLRISKHKIVLNRSVFIGAVSMAATTVLFCAANKMTTAANAILLQYTSPVFIILFMWLLFKQTPKLHDVVMCLCVLAGILCFFFDSLSAGHMLGDALALLSGLFYAVLFLCNILPGGDAPSSFFFGEVLSALVGLPFLFGETDFSAHAVGGALLLGLIIGVGFALLSLSLKTTSPIAANLISGVEPVLNPMWVAIFAGERMTPLAIIGFIIVLASIIVYQLSTRIRIPRTAEK